MQVDGLGEQVHGLSGVVQSLASLGVHEIGVGVLLVEWKCLLASLSHHGVVFHHIGHLGHAQPHRHVVGLGLRDHLQLPVSLLQVARGDTGPRKVVAALEVVGVELKGVVKTLGGILKLMLLEGAHAVVFEHLEILFFLLLGVGGSILNAKQLL